MLKNKIRTHEETEQYMTELKSWLEQERHTPTEEMKDFFSKRVNIYENVHLEHWAEEYAHIADFFDSELNSLLDIGCGTGLELSSIYQRFPTVNVTGVDLSEDMLNILQHKYKSKKIELILSDYFKYPFAKERYEAAMSFETLHHFKYEKKKEMYEKLFQTIKPGGYYIECDYIACCDEEEQICLELYEYKRKEKQIADDVFVHIDIPLTFEHQKELMINAGFSNVQSLYENCGTMVIRAEK